VAKLADSSAKGAAEVGDAASTEDNHDDGDND